jgi:DNA-binding XRE family transcriptional regulator
MTCEYVNHDEIRRQRLLSGLEPEAVALELHRSKESIKNWETGQSAPPLKMVFALADLFGCSVVDLLIIEPSAVSATPTSRPVKRRLTSSPPRKTGAA